ncbi:MAG: matrixin family metalloprotease [Planctomycetes bacterium]|nr:matrixin family metalloprotease [Planctomycetota bacterium]
MYKATGKTVEKAIIILAFCFTCSSAFGYALFSTPTAWAPGENTINSAKQPTPGGATFSIAPENLVYENSLRTEHGTNKTQNITALGIAGFEFDDYVTMVDDALDIWASVSGFENLGNVTDSGNNIGTYGEHTADIRIAAWELTKPSALAQAWQPSTQDFFADGALGGDMHIDVGRTWIDDAADSAGNGKFDLFSVILHELGHSIGLAHSTVAGSVMAPNYIGANRNLHIDDIAGAQALYGNTYNTAYVAVPEPTTIALLGLGALLIKKRKK